MNVAEINRRTFRLLVVILIGIQAAGYPIWVAAKPSMAVKAVKSKPTRGKQSAVKPAPPLTASDPASNQIIKIAEVKPNKAPAITAEPNPKAPFAFRAKIGGTVARFQDRARRAGVQLYNGNAAVGFFLHDSTGSTSIKTRRDRIDFIKGDTKVSYSIAGDRVKEEIVLNSKPPNSTWAFNYREDDVRREPAGDGGWRYFDRNGAEVWRILPATVKDARGVAGEVSMTIRDSILTLSVDPAFLQQASYPVVIDPTVVTTTTAFAATSFTINRKLVRTKSGALFLLYQGGSGLAYRVSTDTGTTWGAPTSISTTTRFEASVVIDRDDNIYATYTDNAATDTVAFRKLTYSGNDSWTVGGETIVTTEAAPRYPSINRDTGGRIWVSYRFNNTNIYVRYSDDNGASWSASTVLASSHSAGSSLLVPYMGYPAAVFEPNATSLAWKYWDGASWSATQTIMVGTNIEDYSFSAVVTRDNYVHVAYTDGAGGQPTFIRHTYYDGAVWSAPVDVTTATGDRGPQLTTNGRSLWLFWSQFVGASQYRLVFKKYDGAWEASPTLVTPSSERQFDQVFTDENGDWTDETADASNAIAADVPLFVKKKGIIYVGLSEKFDYIYFDLSTWASSTIGPTWEYWNGTAWSPLVITENPTYDFTADGNVRFTPPADWDVTSVNGSANFYYVRISGNENVAITLVASQFTSIKNNAYPATILKDLEIVGVAWSEGQNPNYNILFQSFAVSTITLTIDSTFNRDGTPGSNSNDFGSVPPYDSPFLIHPDAAKHAVQLTVASDVDWDLLVESSGDFDAGGGKTMPINQLNWRSHATVDPWTSFSTSPTAMLTNQAPTLGSTFRYDFQLITTWNDDPGTYLTTVTYTALPTP